MVGYGSQGHAHANNLKDSGVDVMLENVGESDMMMERDEIPIKMVAIEIDHNLVPNNTTNDSTDSSSQSHGDKPNTLPILYFGGCQRLNVIRLNLGL